MAPKHHATPLSGGDRKALNKELGKARAMANIPVSQSLEMRAKGEALIHAATVTAQIPDRAKGKPIEIWFQDEARIGRQGTLTRIWAKRGTRPRAPQDQRYDSVYLFGAACPQRRAAAGLGACI
jgi:hypothetical protein